MSDTRQNMAFGIYPARSAMETGLETLEASGYRNTDISVLFPDLAGTENFAHQKGTKLPETKAAASGAVAGAAIGGIVVGVSVLTIPGIGPLLAAGPIVATLAALGAGGAPGGVAGALMGMDIPEYEAKHYEGIVKDGGIFLAVHSDTADMTNRAKEILLQTGAQDVSVTTEDAGYVASDDRLPGRAVGR